MTKLLATALLHMFAATTSASADVGVPVRESVPHITTTGSASLEVIPDQADITLGVSTERATADEATQITAKAAADVIEAVKARGIDPKDIKTTFGISAQYDYGKDPVSQAQRSTLRGYAAIETIAVRLRDITKAGSVARELIAKGANFFQRIDYSYTREKIVRRQLDAEAMRDALDAAKTYTDAANLTLGRVLQIGGEIQAPDGEADLPSRRPPSVLHIAIPTEPGTQKLTESVSVIWEIEGKAH